jgi:hypothetical protein
MLKGGLMQQWLLSLLIILTVCTPGFSAENFLDYVREVDETPRASL